MKERISITIDEETAKKIMKILEKNKVYRNRSHFVETAIEKFVEEESKKK